MEICILGLPGNLTMMMLLLDKKLKDNKYIGECLPNTPPTIIIVMITAVAGNILFISSVILFQVSFTNKLLIPMYWFKSFWFGRDISKF